MHICRQEASLWSLYEHGKKNSGAREKKYIPIPVQLLRVVSPIFVIIFGKCMHDDNGNGESLEMKEGISHQSHPSCEK
jgi:hypothetical protein